MDSRTPIIENSLFSTSTGKDEFTKNKQKIINAFYLNIGTIIGYYVIDKDKSQLNNYMLKAGSYPLRNINDDSHDFLLVKGKGFDFVIKEIRNQAQKRIDSDDKNQSNYILNYIKPYHRSEAERLENDRHILSKEQYHSLVINKVSDPDYFPVVNSRIKNKLGELSWDKRGIINYINEADSEFQKKVIDQAIKSKTLTNISRFMLGADIDKSQGVIFDSLEGAQLDKVYEELQTQDPYSARKLLQDKTTEQQLRKFFNDIKTGDIRPLIDITNKKLHQISKYNKISVTGVRKKKKESLSEYVKRMEDSDVLIPKLAVDKIDLEETDLEKMTLEYHKFSNGRHGNTALKIVESFDVNLPDSNFKQFLKEHPNSEIIKPAFHGTGSIAASFILRKGFQVIKRTDSSVVGRMLGDGIYFSNVVDKAAQYVGDAGYSRRHGTQGYLLEMEAAIGEQGVDYKAAGLGSDHIRSPEWCVFNPGAQLRIYKVHRVVTTDKNEIDRLNAKHKVITEGYHQEVMRFSQWLNEGTRKVKNRVNYIFKDGNIPISRREVVPFEEFPIKKYRNVSLEYSQEGPVLSIKINDDDNGARFVTNTLYWMINDRTEFNLFLKRLK